LRVAMAFLLCADSLSMLDAAVLEIPGVVDAEPIGEAVPTKSSQAVCQPRVPRAEACVGSVESRLGR